ncbi:hypothetical protein [Janthinobacterium fluminis]|uniref:Uncharacterized protein n=1 Tax=Janthinobacterium fluminis TaxID=2987524 RepID=A0ABT5JZQ5_9BURK|nr:hypothetical protein [Janthinobacterium fluminis]MDC8757541.1 hypothetical protein [Janthinobacterium fluminis]
MRRRGVVVGAAALGVVGAAVLAMWPAAPAGPGAPAAALPAQGPAARPAAPADWPPAFADGERELKRVALTPLEPAVPAAYSMALARQNGDPRTPPISRDEAPAPPSAAELADPQAYQGYEARQSMKLYAGYVQAADADIPALRRDIEQGRKMGAAPEEIAKVEEKLRRIVAMRAELLAQHPELARAGDGKSSQ